MTTATLVTTLARTAVFGAFCLAASRADAHVSIWPQQSMAGATERYTVRVPTEGKVATVSAELTVPEGVIMGALSMPQGWKQEIKRENDRIAGIKWVVNIPEGQFLEFGFIAKNPRNAEQIVWKLKQTLADGTVTDWTNGPQGLRPTAVTKLTPRPAE